MMQWMSSSHLWGVVGQLNSFFFARMHDVGQNNSDGVVVYRKTQKHTFI